jgi:hypothetical protein
MGQLINHMFIVGIIAVIVEVSGAIINNKAITTLMIKTIMQNPG